jgi:hypothetical protein
MDVTATKAKKRLITTVRKKINNKYHGINLTIWHPITTPFVHSLLGSSGGVVIVLTD